VTINTQLNLSAITVRAIYSDGSAKIITSDKYTATGVDINTPGMQTLTVTYVDTYEGQITATVGVMVVAMSDIVITGTYPAYIKAGDRVYWLTTGAYTSSYCSTEFNGFPPLPVYFVK
jgi:diaminopimelate decarboxylase